MRSRRKKKKRVTLTKEQDEALLLEKGLSALGERKYASRAAAMRCLTSVLKHEVRAQGGESLRTIVNLISTLCNRMSQVGLMYAMRSHKACITLERRYRARWRVRVVFVAAGTGPDSKAAWCDDLSLHYFLVRHPPYYDQNGRCAGRPWVRLWAHLSPPGQQPSPYAAAAIGAWREA